MRGQLFLRGWGRQRLERAASRQSKGRGTGARALSRQQKDQDTTGPPEKQARGPTVTHTRAVSRRLGRRPACHSPTRCSGGAASTHLVRLSSLFRLVQLQGSSPGDTLSSEVARPVPVNRHQLRLGRGQACRAPHGCGTGEPGPGVPLLGSPRGCAVRREHTCRPPYGLPKAGRVQRDPPQLAVQSCRPRSEMFTDF